MTTRIGASVHVDPAEITHFVHGRCPVLTFGPYPTVERVDLFLGDVACIDAVIAELVALRNEVEPYAAVIIDSERDCDEVNPEGHWPCHRSGDHGVHRDANGDEWRSDVAEVAVSL